MFTSGYQETNQEIVRIDDCSPQTFTSFLEWCYTDKINESVEGIISKSSSGELFKSNNNSNNNNNNNNDIGKEGGGEEGSELLPEMLVLADKYGAFSLFRVVEGKLLEGVDVSNILGIMQFAEIYNANFLAEFCLNFIAKEYDNVLERGGDKEMNDELKEKVRERRALLLGASKEEQQKKEIEERMRLYENERREQMLNPEKMGVMARAGLGRNKPSDLGISDSP
jgi:hypothetical protein